MQLTIPSSFDQIIDYVKDINLSSRQQQTIGLITAATVISSFTFYKLFKGPNDGCPTVPYINPFNGSSAEYRKNPRAFVEKWTEKLGPVYRVHLYGRLQTVVSGRYVREIFMNNNFDFNAGIEKRFDMKSMADIRGHEIPASDTRVSVVQYLTPHLKYFTPRAVHYLDVGLEDILGDMQGKKKDLPHLYPLVQRMVSRASASVFVGEKLCNDPNLVTSFQEITGDLGAHIRFSNPWLEPFQSLMKLKMWAIGKFSTSTRKHRSVMLKALIPEIKSRMELAKNPNWERPNDILQDLIENFKAPAGRDFATHITNEIIVLIFASIHTTSENGTIVLYRILNTPGLVEELFKEQQEVLTKAGLDPNGKSSEVFTFDIIKNMVKLDSVCRESMRLRNEFLELAHTNVGKNRVVLSNGTIIQPDGDVLINSWYNQQSNSWDAMKKDKNEDRTKFTPLRYVNSGYPSTKVSDDYLVFGEGKHACPGRWFAIQEIKTIISLLIRDYKLQPTSDIIFPDSLETAMPFGTVSIEKGL
ncbi:cytochrome P450 [Phascolomyces articulosus]|uniref:Cytochrome P450 n=1 Tax=Phascolomyces articulosus TaxID=60185 RepID=A0AAD5KDN0_9FUNG|nr:cytochrome P450 [Phascolomyces articulosus]